MSMIEILSDENNSFLSRREIICDFKALGGKLKKLEAVEMITKELKLVGKIVIPIKLQNHTGQPKITGIFYVYDDEKLAREHVNPAIFARLDKAKSKKLKRLQMQNQKTETPKEKPKDDKAADAEPAKTETPKEKPKADDKAADAEPAKIDAPTDKSDTKTKDKGEDI